MASGTDAVCELIEEEGWSYPVSVRRLDQKHALANIEIDEKGNSMMLGELLAKTGPDVKRFEDEEDVHAKLHPLFEQEREDRRVGIIGRLKRTFLGER